MIAPSISATYNGGPLEVLSRLISKREAVLRETMKDAVTATAITVVKSLRALTKTAPEEPNPHMFRVYRLPGVAGWSGPKSRRRRTARLSSHGPVMPDVKPVNLMYGLKGEGYVFQITLANENVPWSRTLNKGRYVVMAPDATVAMRYAADRVRRLLRKERGMGRDALGWAMAKLSTRSAPVEAKGGKSRQIAAKAAVVSANRVGDDFSLHVADNLNYAKLAREGGKGAMETAMMRAANSIAGRLRKAAGTRLDMDLQTPFPEVTK